jgi:hypothetical protein
MSPTHHHSTTTTSRLSSSLTPPDEEGKRREAMAVVGVLALQGSYNEHLAGTEPRFPSSPSLHHALLAPVAVSLIYFARGVGG